MIFFLILKIKSFKSKIKIIIKNVETKQVYKNIYRI